MNASTEHGDEARKERHETPLEQLDRNWADLLQELRVSQTGVQLLTGFLLTLPFQSRFTELNEFPRTTYLITMALSVISTAFLIAPVSVHRMLFRRHARRATVQVGHRLAIIGIVLVLILVPVTLLLAVALAPLGNQVLPLVDLATIPFIVAMMVPIFRGNVVRSVIGGAIVIGLGLFIASATAASFTSIAVASGFELPAGTTQISSLVDGANPLTGLFFWVSGFGGWTIAVLAVAALGFAYWVSRVEKKRDAARAEEAAASS